MPYSAAHAASTRGRIVDAARRLFNRKGFAEVTIEQIMAEAGLTRGGFYHHFQDKESLFVEVVATFSSCSRFAAEIAAHPEITGDAQAMAHRLIDLYLSDEVFNNSDLHCPLYALPSDSARNGMPPAQPIPAWSPASWRSSKRRWAAIRMPGRAPAPSCPCASAGWCWRGRPKT